jgi:sarcosine oxidase delta subunit
MSSAIILPCPFCGESAQTETEIFGDSKEKNYRIRCTKGHALNAWHDLWYEARNEWNQRFEKKPVRVFKGIKDYVINDVGTIWVEYEPNVFKDVMGLKGFNLSEEEMLKRLAEGYVVDISPYHNN